MRETFQPVLDVFSRILLFIHDLAEPLFGVHSWGWAIIGLTLIVRVLLLPLAIKQTRSMKAIQQLQPEIKTIQEKYKTDREMMRKDPEKYRARKQKQQQEMMALYQREGANPAASCLPLLAQAPVFIALFWTLVGEAELTGAPFYFFTEASPGGLEKLVSGAGWPGWLLIVLMSGTMFFSQKQMMARNAATMADNPMAQQQKILLYVMPIFLAVISFQFPLGVLLYWVTTNLWQIVQQAIILREGAKIDAAAEKRRGPGANGVDTPPPAGPARGATSGKKRTWDETHDRRAGSGPASDSTGAADARADAADTDGSATDHPSEVEDYSSQPDTESTSSGGPSYKGGPGGAGSDAPVTPVPSPAASEGPSGGRRRLPRRGGV
jgi:YidC/Oxa1 family membrane protein insertase